MTTQTKLQEILVARGEFPVTDPAKREAYAQGIVVGLDDEEVIVPETNPLFALAVEAGEHTVMMVY